jgi:hypothetical protein
VRCHSAGEGVDGSTGPLLGSAPRTVCFRGYLSAQHFAVVAGGWVRDSDGVSDAADNEIKASEEGLRINKISRGIYRVCPTGNCLDDLHNFAKLHLSTIKPFLVRTPGDERPTEVDLSATHALLATATGLCLTGPLIWLFVRYWLFAL